MPGDFSCEDINPFFGGMVKSYVTPFKEWKSDLQLGENIATFWNYLKDFFLRKDQRKAREIRLVGKLPSQICPETPRWDGEKTTQKLANMINKGKSTRYLWGVMISPNLASLVTISPEPGTIWQQLWRFRSRSIQTLHEWCLVERSLEFLHTLQSWQVKGLFGHCGMLSLDPKTTKNQGLPLKIKAKWVSGFPWSTRYSNFDAQRLQAYDVQRALRSAVERRTTAPKHRAGEPPVRCGKGDLLELPEVEMREKTGFFFFHQFFWAQQNEGPPKNPSKKKAQENGCFFLGVESVNRSIC